MTAYAVMTAHAASGAAGGGAVHVPATVPWSLSVEAGRASSSGLGARSCRRECIGVGPKVGSWSSWGNADLDCLNG